MERYRRLSLMEREELSRMLAAGYSLRATAQVMQQAPRTVSRELARRWSPEQIAHGLPQRYPDEPTMRISHGEEKGGRKRCQEPLFALRA